MTTPTDRPTPDLALLTGRTRLPAELANASGMKKLDWIFNHPDPAAWVQELAPQELYYWIRDIGKGDAYSLIELADREQKRALVDIDAWNRHEMVLPRWLEWLDLALASDDDTALDFIAAQDDETIEWLFTGDVQVYPADHDLDTVPDELAAFHTPDGMYLITVPRDHELEERLPKLLKLLWAADEDRARVVLQQVQFDLRSNIVEDMRRFRDARIQDMGFEPAYEALEVYATLPVKALRDDLRKAAPDPDATTELHGAADATGLVRDLVLSGIEAPELLGDALALLAPADRARAGEALAYLTNKLFVADTGDLSRVDDLPIAARHAAAVANVGLEYLADGDVEQAARILRTTSAETLFRAGHTLTLEVGRVAHGVLVRTGANRGLELFGTPTDQVLHGAGLVRPMFHEGLDAPELMGYRPFKTMLDLARVEVAVQDALALTTFFEERFGFSPAALEQLELKPDAVKRVRFATLFRTAIAWALLRDEPAFRPLAKDDIAAFARAAFVHKGSAVALSAPLTRVVATVAEADVPDAVRRFVDRSLDELLDALGRVHPESIEPRFTGDMFLISGG